jgi:aminoglycoside 3'-phosphotransferase-2
MMQRSQLPGVIRAALTGYRGRPVRTGESGADLSRWTAKGRPPLFLKRMKGGAHYSLLEEAQRLEWIGARLPAPKVVAAAGHGGSEWLLMTGIAGKNGVETSLPQGTIVRLVAEALKALHAFPVAGCPFDESLDRKLERARSAVADGLVEEEHFDCDNLGRSAQEILSELEITRPGHEEMVVTHGDACLPNFMLARGRFAGFVDCARLGRADRYHDLALACRSIEGDLGDDWVAPFLEQYGVRRVDRKRLAYYRLLDELA